MRDSRDVAIVGMACVFPGARDLDAYWANLKSGFDAITDVPKSRWDPIFYDPSSTALDRFYCKRGGFIDDLATFDAIGFGVMPHSARSAEPDQLLALDVGTRALADAGYADRPFARDRTGVILGRGNYASAGRTRIDSHVRVAEQIIRAVRALVPDVSEAELQRIKREYQANLGAATSGDAIGIVPNLTASRLAHRLDLQGPAFTVDAACASALVAVDHACAELASNRSDMIIAGGVHVCQDETFWSVFCQLGALSRGQQIRPFDRRADGILIGEGIGVVVLKRLADAERDDDRIYATIRGTGVASDGREMSLMTPRVEGQLLALERAWSSAEIDRTRIGVLEAHGTGTPAGDGAELETIAKFFGGTIDEDDRACLGSVKSMIGHSMPAAGAAGLIKAALAVHHGVLLPSIHCEEPNEALADTRFRVLAREEPWEERYGSRVAGVSAFGFGGINAHVVIESAPGRSRKPRVSTQSVSSEKHEKAAFYAAESIEALAAQLESGVEQRTGGPARLAIVDPTPESIARARAIVAKGKPWRGKDGIWFSPSGLVSTGGRVAFLFPGVDSTFEPRVDDVASRFGVDVPAHAEPKSTADLQNVGVGIVGVNRLLNGVLGALGVRADLYAGHSVGEWSAMMAAGALPEAAIDAFIAKMGPGALVVPGVVFAAAGCDVSKATRAMEGLPEIAISHDNCPHQIILCGIETSIDAALERLKKDGILCQKLPFQSGFHSPLFEDYLGPHRKNFADFPMDVPRSKLYSATTCSPFPQSVDAIRALSVEHLVKPVRFRELIEALYAEGARLFVQVGTGSLAHFVEDTLRGRPHVAMSANVKERSGMAQLSRLAAMLFVEGVDLRLEALFGSGSRRERPRTQLELGVPLVELTTPLARAPRSIPPASARPGPVASKFAAAMSEIAEAQTEVLTALSSRPPPPSRPPRISERPREPREPREIVSTRSISVENFPEIRDHAFFRQPPGWSNDTDLHLVVPMTMSIDLMMEAARALVPDRVIVSVDHVRAYRWLVASRPVDVTIRATLEGEDRVAVAIEGYNECTVVFGRAYPEMIPDDDAPLEGEPLDAVKGEMLYESRWMFHGPQYQGVVRVLAITNDGVRAELVSLPARGALHDGAGQLVGYWVIAKHDRDRMALPIGIEKIRFFSQKPANGARVICTLRVRRDEEREIACDMTLSCEGKVYARIERWADRRFDTDDRLWDVLQFPETHLLAPPNEDGVSIFEDRYRSAPTRDQLARRYLGERERAIYETVGPRKQRAWLSGRIAAKDAARGLLFSRGTTPIFPIEVTIDNDERGAPFVICEYSRNLRVSIAHKEELAIAMVADGKNVGVDVEKIAARDQGFVDVAFEPSELKLVSKDARERDEDLTRLWVAKECVAKLRGTGLEGKPRAFVVTDRAGERLLCEGTWVETRRRGDFILGWTPVPEDEPWSRGDVPRDTAFPKGSP